MNRKFLKIKNIPAILWGEKTDKLIIAVHGNMSNKEDVPIKILAEIAVKKGYQVLSFDLVGHGERKNESEHWFHTEKDLEELRKWLAETI